MNLHEYQARDILRQHGIPVPPGDVASTPAEAKAIAERLGGKVVVKAQVHTGGRGKAGGVKLAKTAAEAEAHAKAILGMTIKGLTVHKVLVAPAAEIASARGVGRLTMSVKPIPARKAASSSRPVTVASITPARCRRCQKRRPICPW